MKERGHIFSKCAVAFAAFVFSVILAAVPANAADGEGTTAIQLDKYSSLDSKASDAATGLVRGEFKAEAAELDKVNKEVIHKIECPEDGYYRISFGSRFRGEEGMIRDWDNNSAVFTLCTDALATKPVEDFTIELGLGEETHEKFAQLTKGTYYLMVEPNINNNERNIDTTYAVSFGYLPLDTEFIKVEKTLDIPSKKVLLTVEGLDAESLKIQAGNESGWELSGVLWDGCPEIKSGGQFTITEPGEDDGYYTIRLQDTYGNVYGRAVKIDEFDKPAVPQIVSYKSGAASISGKAAAGCTVSVSAAGAAYTAIASDNGTWTVKTAKMKKGASFSVYAKDAVGNTSKTTKGKVK